MRTRPELDKLPDTHHGAPNFAELEKHGFHPDEVVDFSVNSNPFGPSPRIRSALQQVPIARYPDRESLTLRRALADKHSTNIKNILVGNGSAELMLLIVLTYLESGSRVLICGPTFDEYQKFAAVMGAETDLLTAREEDSFVLDWTRIAQVLKAKKYRMIFICSPNNPTGQIISADCIQKLGQLYPETLFVIDEAYISFANEVTSSFDSDHENILILRSMTKDYSLAGLRLGYALGAEQTISAVASVRPPWNVNAYAQKAGLTALQDQSYLEQTLLKTWEAAAQLRNQLAQLGLTPFPSHTHFFLLPVGDASRIRKELFQKGIQVRDCSSFGLPAFIRISTLTPDKNQLLVEAISDLL